jgi:hypothetical protein|tara:strand:- start:23 stop:124 length:102 start_codon:yes stop_codon:yes gene_type:complete
MADCVDIAVFVANVFGVALWLLFGRSFVILDSE